MTLQKKITFVATILLLIFMLSIHAAVYLLFQHTIISAELDRINSEAEVILEALAEGNDQVEASELLKAYVPSSGMIRVINQQGKAIQTVTKDTNLTAIATSFRSNEEQKIIKTQNDYRYAVITIPFIWQTDEVVTIEVIETIDYVDQTMQTLRIVLFLASLLMILPAWLGGLWVSKLVVKPIRVLIKSMKKNQQDGTWEKITHQKKSKDELYQLVEAYNAMINRLQANFEQQEQFISNASHELKTPLAVISSYTQLLERQRKKRPELVEEAIEAIQFEIKRMTALTNQMLTLASIDHAHKLTVQPINIISLCKETIKTFRVSFNREIKLTIDEQDVLLYCDKEKINQVLYILLDNAHKYSNGPIDVFLEKKENNVIISVNNKGQAIPEDSLVKMFDRFYRLDKARNSEAGGTGLGLSIAKMIIQKHDGDIHAESSEDKGTTIIFTLPIK